MVINYERRWVYLGPPKTGSTTLSYVLTDGDDWNNRQPMRRRVFGGTKCLGQHSMDVPAECQGFFVFASIRNPYSRAVSLWWHWNTESNEHHRHPTLSFEQYLETVLRSQSEPESQKMAGNGFFHFTLMRWFKWVPKIDRYIRQEFLEDDLNRLELAEAVDAPQQNCAPGFRPADDGDHGNQPWQSYYSAQAIAMVRAWARDDFDQLGYPDGFPEQTA